ncbi:MAG: hypothetical protein K5765_06030 [Clostridia bacterium]|nr:hypothetical protein [Clostridia bacterium]
MIRNDKEGEGLKVFGLICMILLTILGIVMCVVSIVQSVYSAIIPGLIITGLGIYGISYYLKFFR